VSEVKAILNGITLASAASRAAQQPPGRGPPALGGPPDLSGGTEGGESSEPARERSYRFPTFGRPLPGGTPACIAGPEEYVPQSVTSLPTWENRRELAQYVRDNQVICVKGETGCGKSTCVPFIILRDSPHACIVVTQPRRMAAKSLAQRVASLVGGEVGGLVGYAVGQDSKYSASTRVLYCTTGWMLSWLAPRVNKAKGSGLEGEPPPDLGVFPFTHIILDEVHERSVDADFLSLLLKKSPTSLLPDNTRFLVMSATLETHIGDYLLQRTAASRHERHARTPTISVGQHKRFHVEPCFLDDYFRDRGGGGKLESAAFGAANQLKPDKPKLSKPMCRFVVLACEDLLKYAATDPAIGEASALVFAPGVAEIEELYDEFLRLLGPERYDLIMLHSRAPPEEQDRALQPASYGKMKVVISTNIAESSITIPDVYVIVDLCMVKEVEYDPKVGANSLKVKYASQASAQQRLGRAGRVQPGVCIRCVPQQMFREFEEFSTCEMQRASLDEVVLKCRSTLASLGGANAVLAQAVSPPSPTAIKTSLASLHAVGCLDGPAEDARVTLLGSLASVLPIEVSLSKLAMAGLALDAPIDSVVMAGALAVDQSIWACPFIAYEPNLASLVHKVRQVHAAKMDFAQGTLCDALTMRNVVRAWLAGPRTMYWADSRGINLKRLKQMMFSISDISERLQNANLDFLGAKGSKAKRALAILSRDIRSSRPSAPPPPRDPTGAPAGGAYVPPGIRAEGGAGNRYGGVDQLTPDEGGWTEDLDALRAATAMALCCNGVLESSKRSDNKVAQTAASAGLDPQRTVQLKKVPHHLSDLDLSDVLGRALGTAPSQIRRNMRDALVEFPPDRPPEPPLPLGQAQPPLPEGPPPPLPAGAAGGAYVPPHVMQQRQNGSAGQNGAHAHGPGAAGVSLGESLRDMPTAAKMLGLLPEHSSLNRSEAVLRLPNTRVVVGDGRSDEVVFADFVGARDQPKSFTFDGGRRWEYKPLVVSKSLFSTPDAVEPKIDNSSAVAIFADNRPGWNQNQGGKKKRKGGGRGWADDDEGAWTPKMWGLVSKGNMLSVGRSMILKQLTVLPPDTLLTPLLLLCAWSGAPRLSLRFDQRSAATGQTRAVGIAGVMLDNSVLDLGGLCLYGEDFEAVDRVRYSLNAMMGGHRGGADLAGAFAHLRARAALNGRETCDAVATKGGAAKWHVAESVDGSVCESAWDTHTASWQPEQKAFMILRPYNLNSWAVRHLCELYRAPFGQYGSAGTENVGGHVYHAVSGAVGEGGSSGKKKKNKGNKKKKGGGGGDWGNGGALNPSYPGFGGHRYGDGPRGGFGGYGNGPQGGFGGYGGYGDAPRGGGFSY